MYLRKKQFFLKKSFVFSADYLVFYHYMQIRCDVRQVAGTKLSVGRGQFTAQSRAYADSGQCYGRLTANDNGLRPHDNATMSHMITARYAVCIITQTAFAHDGDCGRIKKRL